MAGSCIGGIAELKGLPGGFSDMAFLPDQWSNLVW